MIINPMFFYLMYVSENISVAMIACGVAMIVISIIMFIVSGDSLFFDDKTGKSMRRWSKCMIPAGIIFCFIGLLIPDKETLLLMQAARLATTETVNSVFEALKAAMDYAVTILQ